MYLGLDLGTSGLKALIIDEDQRVVAATTQPLETSRPHSGWSEQDPAAWIAAAEGALDELKACAPRALGAVSGVGLSGQMHGATFLDASDAALRPCILWNDSRSAKQAARLDADPQFRAVTGTIVFPGFTAPKLAWLRENEPETARRVAKILLPKDYLRLWLTGEHAADLNDASGTAWLDTASGRWSEALLDASGASIAMTPRLVDSVAVSGVLRPALAARWGMGSAVVVAGGSGDSGASAIGVGAVSEGDAFISIGTSGILLVSKDAFRPSPESAVHTFGHAAPGRWIQIGVILSAASSLSWFAALASSTPARLIGALGRDLQAPGETVFLPYLSGERTPHNDAEIRGAFLGLGHESDLAAVTRALIEGVAFAFRDNLDAVASTGARPRRVLAVGGGARSTYWLKAIATALDLPVDAPKDNDVGAAMGAARLGQIAATGGDWRALCAAPAIERTIEPAAELVDAFDAAHARHRAAYARLRADRGSGAGVAGRN